jgi:hypothetical protein
MKCRLVFIPRTRLVRKLAEEEEEEEEEEEIFYKFD